MSKIALTCITKNEQESLPRMITSVLPEVDAVFVVDTGSTDQTVERTRAMGATVFETKDQFYVKVDTKAIDWCRDFIGKDILLTEGDSIFDFASARNYSFEVVPKEYDWVLWLDSDDVLRGKENLREAVKVAEDQKADEVFFNYLYHCEFKPNGDIHAVLVQHLRERLIRNNGCVKWVGMIHETPVDTSETRKIDLDVCDVLHMTGTRKITQSIQRNVKALEYEVYRLNGKDPRPIYYLAKAYFDLHQDQYNDLAEKLIYKYLEMSGWAEERAQAHEYLAQIFAIRRDYTKSKFHYHQAMMEDPKFPSFYIGMAQTHLLEKEWEKALRWADIASHIEEPHTTLVSSPRDNIGKILEVIYYSNLQTNKLDPAYEAITKLADLFPGREDIQKNLEFATNLKAEKEVTKQLAQLIRYYEALNDRASVTRLLNSLPMHLHNNAIIAEWRKIYTPPKVWADKSVVIYAGTGFELWSPKTIEAKGSGGSEEAIYRLSRELVKKGYAVTVYGDPGEDAGTYDGVTYDHWFNWNYSDTFDVFIAWRNVKLYDMDIKARIRLLDLHDIPNSFDFTDSRVAKVSKILVKSQWHRNYLKSIPDDKFVIVGNGGL
jgi:glycosyltransferase involved in cell wall biosynthesis